MAEAYCVRDKMKVEIQNPQKITMKNGKPAIKGTCPKCGNEKAYGDQCEKCGTSLSPTTTAVWLGPIFLICFACSSISALTRPYELPHTT